MNRCFAWREADEDWFIDDTVGSRIALQPVTGFELHHGCEGEFQTCTKVLSRPTALKRSPEFIFFGRTSSLKSILCCVALFFAGFVTELGAQSYGLVNRPAVGPFLNGFLPSSLAAPFPALLSQTGAFSDVASMTTSPGLIPFDVSSPLWTDGVLKWRWIAVPPNTQIAFAESSPWHFPPGTVSIFSCAALALMAET